MVTFTYSPCRASGNDDAGSAATGFAVGAVREEGGGEAEGAGSLSANGERMGGVRKRE